MWKREAGGPGVGAFMSAWRGALLLALILAALPGAALAAQADLDPGFGTGGIRTIDRGGAESIGDMVLQLDGKIVVVGGGPDGNFLVARLNPNGSPDGGFDGDGFASIDFGGAAESAYSVALQRDGKIVVAGRGGANAAVARLNPNGSLDGGFAVGGRRLLDYGPNVGIGFPARAVEVDRDGKIVVAGSGPEGEFTLTRLNPDGGFDATVDVDGVRTVLVPQLELTDPERDLFVNQIGFQRDGKIMLAGNVTYHLGPQDVYAIAATRSNLDGSLDPAFGMGGRVAASSWRTPVGLLGEHDRRSARRQRAARHQRALSRGRAGQALRAGLAPPSQRAARQRLRDGGAGNGHGRWRGPAAAAGAAGERQDRDGVRGGLADVHQRGAPAAGRLAGCHLRRHGPDPGYRRRERRRGRHRCAVRRQAARGGLVARRRSPARPVRGASSRVTRSPPAAAAESAAAPEPAGAAHHAAAASGRRSWAPGKRDRTQAATRTRTGDPIFTRDVLYQLSYGGGSAPKIAAGASSRRARLSPT